MDLNTNPILATLPDPGLSGKIDIFQPCSLKARFILLTSHQDGGNGGALSPPVALTRSMCADTARSSPRQQVLIRSLWYFPAPNFKISVDAMRWMLFNAASVAVPGTLQVGIAEEDTGRVMDYNVSTGSAIVVPQGEALTRSSNSSAETHDASIPASQHSKGFILTSLCWQGSCTT